MELQRLPARSEKQQAQAGASLQSQRGYWKEGEGFVVSPAAAKVFTDSIPAIISAFDAAIDYVVKTPAALRTFVFDEDPQVNRHLQALVKASWQNQSRSYVLDRFDLAWDGVSPPQVLERNFGYLGLTVGTGPVQEDYAFWLAKQKGWRGVRPFASLQEGFVRSIREVTRDHGLVPNEYMVLATQEQRKTSDPGMIRAGQVLEQWIARAGFSPVNIPVIGLACTGDHILMTQSFGRDSELYSDLRIKDRRARTFVGASVAYALTGPSIYPFYGFHSLASSSINSASKKAPLPKLSSTCLQPWWTLLMGHKRLMVYIHQLFPDHPNFLPTFGGVEALSDQMRIVKEVDNCQGHGAVIIDADNNLINARESRLAQYTEAQRRRQYITQAFAPSTAGPDGHFRVINAFTTNRRLAGVGARVAPGHFVGGDDTETGFRAVLIRPDLPPPAAEQPSGQGFGSHD